MRVLMLMVVMAGCSAPLDVPAPAKGCGGRELQSSCGGVPVCVAVAADCGAEGQDCCTADGTRQSGLGAYCDVGLACNEWRRCVGC